MFQHPNSTYTQTEPSAAESTAHNIIQWNLPVVELANCGTLAKPRQTNYFRTRKYFSIQIHQRTVENFWMRIVGILLVWIAFFHTNRPASIRIFQHFRDSFYAVEKSFTTRINYFDCAMNYFYDFTHFYRTRRGFRNHRIYTVNFPEYKSSTYLFQYTRISIWKNEAKVWGKSVLWARQRST